MIEGITNTQSSQGLGTSIGSSSSLSTDFLRLLTTQLANQDPLSPMDNTEMVQQLATFSQLEQLERVNANLEAQIGFSQSLNNTMMMDVVGKRVTVLGNEVSISNGEPSRTLVRVPEAGVVFPRILDEDGVEVRSLDAQQVTPGFNAIEWDGLDAKGQPLPDGDYTIDFSATDRSGSFMSLAIFSSGIVDTVQFDNNFIFLMVNGRIYAPSDVVEVGLNPNQNVASAPATSSGDDGSVGNDASPPETDTAPFVPTADSLVAHANDSFDALRTPWEALLRIR